MFERFTATARDVVPLADAEAARLHFPAIGTEHLLLGLLAAGPCTAERALREHHIDPAEVRRRVLAMIDDPLDGEALATLGIDLDQVRRTAEEAFGEGALDPRSRMPRRSGRRPFTPRAKKVLELAVREAVWLHTPQIHSAQLLLGLLREGHGVAAQALRAAGTDPVALRTTVTRLLSAEAA